MSSDKEEWEELKLTIDSGACDHVINPEEIPSEDVQITDAVRQGVTYTSASGHAIPNLGQARVQGLTQDGSDMSLTMQVAGVKKPLASVRKMTKAGNRVVFEEISETCGGYVENKESGVKVPISKEGT